MSSDPSSTPADPLLNASCFDLLLIELVPLAEQLTHRYETSLDTYEPPTQASAAATSTSNPTPALSKQSTTAHPLEQPQQTQQPQQPSDLFREGVYVRLEELGFRVGQGLCERFARDRPRFTDQLDVIKFICKDIWTVAFRKQIDNLKTNHRVCYT